jgi:hypothetical protein
MLDGALSILLTAWAVWSLLPAGAWTGVAEPAYYATTWGLWWRTLLVAVLITAMLVVLTRGEAVRVLRRLWDRLQRIPVAPFLICAGAIAALEAASVSVWAFARNPTVIDTWVQYFQARIFLAGSWVAPQPASIAHFATLFMPITERGWFSQYPPIHSALLAVGMAFGAAWLVTPALASLLPAAVYLLGLRSGDARVARLGAMLVLLSPFVIAMDASAMNHLPTALCVAVGLWATCDLPRGRASAAAIFGAMTGLAIGLRPLDGIVLAGIGAIAILASVRPRATTVALVTAGITLVLTLLPTFAYNAATTGDPLTFTYTAIWGRLLGLNHEVPWGHRLTLLRALGNTAIDAHDLNVYFLEWPLPVTALIGAGLCVRRGRLDAAVRVSAGYLLALVGALFFYFHRDTLFGPRVLFSAVPPLAVLLAATLIDLGRLTRSIRAYGLTIGEVLGATVAVSAAVAAATLVPRCLASYSIADTVLAAHPDEDARHAGIEHAVVLIPDGWGTRLIARLWARGVPMNGSTPLYGAYDACSLEERLAAAERDGLRGPPFRSYMEAGVGDASPGLPVPGVTRDPLLRLPIEHDRLTSRCIDEIERDRRGTMQFAAYLYLNAPALDGDIVWARELGDAADAVLARQYPDRPLYRYSPSADGAAAFTLISVPRERT